MSSVSEGQANEELGPFDLSKMTAREIAAELVRRSHPTPPGAPERPDATPMSLTQTESLENHLADVSGTPVAGEPVNQPAPKGNVDSAQDVIVPLPTFLREGDRLAKSSGWEWPSDRAEVEERDPLDVLSRALHNHLQERQSEELHSSSATPGSAAPLSFSREASIAEPLNPSPAVAPTSPAVAAETSWPPASSSARLSDSLDIPVQPSSMHRPPNADLPASLSPGIKFAAEVAAVEPPVSEPGANDSTRPGIRRIRSSDRATERAKVVAQLWLASASAQASTYAARLHLGRKPRPDGTPPAVGNPALTASQSNAAEGETAVSEAAAVDAPMAMIPSSVVSEDLVPEKTSSVRKVMADRFARARQSLNGRVLSGGALSRINTRRINWRGIHWEAVAGGMLLGIVLTIGPAIYFLTAPGRTPALTVIAPPENPPPAVTSSAEPPSSVTSPSAMAPASPTALASPTAPASLEPATTSAAQMEPPPPPTTLQSDPTALATAAGGTSEVAKAAAVETTGSQTTPSQSATAATPEAASTTPPVKPATQKVSTKKQKPKAGTVSAHQPAPTEHLSGAKR